MVVQYPLGRRLEQDIPPHDHWRTQFFLPDARFVKLNFTLPSGAVLGVYGRKNAHPTHARYDFFRALDGNKMAARGAEEGRDRDEGGEGRRRGRRGVEEGSLRVSRSGFLKFLECSREIL